MGPIPAWWVMQARDNAESRRCGMCLLLDSLGEAAQPSWTCARSDGLCSLQEMMAVKEFIEKLLPRI